MPGVLECRKNLMSDKTKIVYRDLDRFYSRGGLVSISSIKNKARQCLWGMHNFIVNHEGDAVLCCEDYFNTVRLGNVGSEKLIDIWNKPYYKQLRMELKKGVFRHAICLKCNSGDFKQV